MNDGPQTPVFATHERRMPSGVHRRPSLPLGEDLDDLLPVWAIDVTGGMLDRNPDLSISPETSLSFPGQPGLKMRPRNGTPLYPVFRLSDSQQTATTLALTCQDLGLTSHATFVSDPETHALTAQAKLTSGTAIVLDWLAAPVLPSPQITTEIADFSNCCTGEFRDNRIPWSPGIRLRENPTDRTGHEHFSGLLIPCLGATNTQGQAYGFHYVRSGGHRMLAEELPDCRQQVQFGHASGSEPAAGTAFVTATLYTICSATGLNGCVTAFQRHLRNWIVKWSDGPPPLFDHIRSEGTSFGLWIEPDMISPDSQLYRAHTDWALGASDQILGRQQMVQNMARSDVRAYPFDRIAARLSTHAIDNIKWDHNRVLPMPDASQARGIYCLLDRQAASWSSRASADDCLPFIVLQILPPEAPLASQNTPDSTQTPCHPPPP